MPTVAGFVLHGFTLGGALRGYVWGGLVRIFLVHHVTWSVNSICHFFGRRRFDIEDQSTNVAWLAVFSLGESWHHNHHAFPRSAYHGLRWWEIDLSGLFISMLAACGSRVERRAHHARAPAPEDSSAPARPLGRGRSAWRGRVGGDEPERGRERCRVRIRDARPEDWEAIWPFFHRIVAARETYAYDPDMTEADARRMWLVGPPGRTVVATDSAETVVGTASMYANREGPGAHVASASFMVDPDRAGQGIGRALGEHVIAWAREDGFRAIQFNAWETNRRLWRSGDRSASRSLGTVPEAFDHPRHGYVRLLIMHRFL